MATGLITALRRLLLRSTTNGVTHDFKEESCAFLAFLDVRPFMFTDHSLLLSQLDQPFTSDVHTGTSKGKVSFCDGKILIHYV